MKAVESIKIMKRLVEESREYEDKIKLINKDIKANDELIENIIMEVEGEKGADVVREEVESCKSLYNSIHRLEKEKKEYQQEVKKLRRTVEEIIMEEGEFDRDQLTFGDIIEGY